MRLLPPWYFQYSGQLHSHENCCKFTYNEFSYFPHLIDSLLKNVTRKSLIDYQQIATFEHFCLSPSNQTIEVHKVWASDEQCKNSISAKSRSSLLPMWKWIDSVPLQHSKKNRLFCSLALPLSNAKNIGFLLTRVSRSTIEKIHKLKCKMFGSPLTIFTIYS